MEMAWGSGTTRLPRGSAIGASRFGRSGSKLKKASSSNAACKWALLGRPLGAPLASR